MGGLPLPGWILLLGTAVPDTGPLVPGEPAAYELAAGVVRTHTVELEAGQFVRLAVVQEGTDLSVTLIVPGGGRTDIDAAERQYGAEPASMVAGTSGTYQIEVRAKDPAAAARYSIESGARRPATAEADERVGAERALAEGVALARKWTPSSARAAVERFDAALRAWRGLGDLPWEAEAMLQRAAARGLVPDHRAKIEDATEALRMARALGDRSAETRALGLIGAAHLDLEDYDRAVEALEQALAVRAPVGDRKDLADIVGSLGWAYGRRADFAKHVELAMQAREMHRGLGDPGLEAWAVMGVGSSHFNFTRFHEAEEAFREALGMFRAQGDRGSEVIALQSLSAVRATQGDHVGGLAILEEALALSVADGNRETEAILLLSVGLAHAAQGEPKKALEPIEKALGLYRELGITRRQAQALNALGSAQKDLGEYERSRATLREALRIASDDGTKTRVLYSLGLVSVEMGRAGEAGEFFRQTGEIARSLGYRMSEANALYRLARIANDAGDLDEARAKVEAALALIEAERRRVTSATLRSTLASTRMAYELYVDVLMGLHRQQPGQGFQERALEVAERARARVLLDQLSEAGEGIRAGVDPALLEKERTIQERLSAALDRQQRLAQSPRTDEQAKSIARSVQWLTTEWDNVRASIKSKSPRFSELREPAPSTIAQVREEVLDEDTLLLAYALGEKRSFLWVVSRTALAAHELPGRAEVDKAAREAHARLSEPASDSARNGPDTDALARLSQMVLGPAARSLTTKRLLIVADGALHYVPFAALPHPAGRGEPLLVRHEIASAPSASVVAILRGEARRRRPAARTLAVLADPVFGLQDERLGAARSSATSPPPGRDDAMRALRSAGVDGVLPRLPFTRREAEAILSLVPPRERKAALDFDASRATAMDKGLADFRLIHFATHGFLNSAKPELSGIVLSLLDRGGADARGFLSTTDVFNLHLNADMVVLSGCRTALGQELRGEGLVGLSRGFMYAGTPRVVASLWKVDDAATAELMKRFYRGVLKERRPPGAALRTAQLEMMRRPRYRDPFYWSAFQLQGEWR